jgi:hypothetical protein
MTKQLITDKIWLVPELNIKENRQAESAKDCKLTARQSSMELRRNEI